LLARVVGIIGPFPEYMMKEGRLVSNFFTREGLIYQEAKDEDEQESTKGGKGAKATKKKKVVESDEDVKIHVLVAKRTTLKKRMNCDDPHFVDFVRWLLEVDPLKRPSAKEALTHPWLTEQTYPVE
jgi:serine/threonine protein kinase